jgi:hypothetical protein
VNLEVIVVRISWFKWIGVNVCAVKDPSSDVSTFYMQVQVVGR